MFQEIPVNEEKIFAFKARGKLTDEDYKAFLPRLTTIIHKYGPLSLLVELEDFRGWELKAAWDDFKFGRDHQKDLPRIAVVGEKQWQKWVTELANVMSDSDIRFFERKQLDTAWDWLRQEEPAHAPAPPPETEPEPEPYKHILVGVDFTRYSDTALKRAVELARPNDASISIVHAIEHIVFSAGDIDGLVPPDDFLEGNQAMYDIAEDRLKAAAESLDYPDVKYQVLWGTPKSAILSYAEAQNVDLVVVGSHGRHGFARLMGSTASGLINNVRCDAIVVKPLES
ncbi:MAG: STAS/SEC14 domain-containing protein [Thiotrichales bacterium]